jgi:tRNA pseudouridine55 synthase
VNATPPRTRRVRRRVDGVLLLDKPPGLSSNAALQRAKRCFDAEKAGHTGTLDPLASGLLPLCFGEATKFAQYLLDATKDYTATVRFGVTTATGDAEGAVLETRPVPIGRADVEVALRGFLGRQTQVPHAYSALKFQGRNYYEYARDGIEIARAPRAIEIHRLALLEWQTPDAVLDVACSKGTYVRVLAEDLGRALGCGAHLAALRRTATGGFRLADTVALETLEAADDAHRDALLLPASVLVRDLPGLRLADEAAARFRQGGAVAAPGLPDGGCAAYSGDVLLGVADVAGGVAQPRRVVAAPPAPRVGHG